MNFEIKEAMKIAIQLTSVSDVAGYKAIIASVNNLKDNDATRTWVTIVFIKQEKRVTKIGKDTTTVSTD